MTQPKPSLNKRVILVSRPAGIAQANDFAIEEAALPPLRDGEVCVANQFLSVDPAMRGWIADSGNYSDPAPIGGVMRSLAVGKVVESRSPDWHAGQIVLGWFGWQQFAIVKPEAIVREVTQIDLPASLALGVLGINGVTALYQMAVSLTHAGDSQSGKSLNLWRPIFGGLCHGFSDRLAG
jgi:NADPH-dependent curcumin reductase